MMQKNNTVGKKLALCSFILLFMTVLAPANGQTVGRGNGGYLDDLAVSELRPPKNNLAETMAPELKKQIADRSRASKLLTEDGVVEMRRWKFTDAERLFREALKINGDNTTAWVNLGNALAHQDRLHEAIAVYRSVLYPGPKRSNSERCNPGVLMCYAILLAQTHQWSEAVYVYEQALPTPSPGSVLPPLDTHFSPKQSQTSLLMAMAYLELGCTQIQHSDNKGASESFAQATKLQPNLAITHLYAAERPGPKTTRKAELEKAAVLGHGAVKAAAERALRNFQ